MCISTSASLTVYSKWQQTRPVQILRRQLRSILARRHFVFTRPANPIRQPLLRCMPALASASCAPSSPGASSKRLMPRTCWPTSTTASRWTRGLASKPTTAPPWGRHALCLQQLAARRQCGGHAANPISAWRTQRPSCKAGPAAPPGSGAGQFSARLPWSG